MHNLEELLKQLRLDPANDELKQKVQYWLRNHSDDDESQEIWERHWQQINTSLTEREYQRLDQLLEKIHKKTKGKQAAIKFQRNIYTKIAAGLLLPVLILAGIHYFKKESNISATNQIVVHESGVEPEHFFLPDRTEVWLNSDSKLSYAQNIHDSKQRLVSLSGEAYLKVYRDASHPFIVQTAYMDIRVLGTSFNVSAYADEKIISSTLEEGSIALQDKQGKQLGKLVPGEQATFKISNSVLTKSKVITTDLTSWKTGKLVFREAGIAEVARKLERRYGYTISISEDLLEENPTYSFSIQKEDLAEICRLIELSTNAKATINGLHIQLEKIK